MKWDRTKGRPEPIHLLNRVAEHESDAPLVDLRQHCPTVRLARPQVIPYARLHVAEMLEEAATSLPSGYRLGLVEAWRPIERQQRIFDFFWKCAVDAFPHRDYRALRRTVCRWAAPTDQKAPPGHCTGGAVDIHLVDDKGELIDVTSPYDRFQSAPTYTFGLSETAQRNRSILVEAMLGAGFSNCRDEFWHYSYGDAAWAVRLGLRDCIYGVARLDPSFYRELELEHIKSMKERVNPFLPPA